MLQLIIVWRLSLKIKLFLIFTADVFIHRREISYLRTLVSTPHPPPLPHSVLPPAQCCSEPLQHPGRPAKDKQQRGGGVSSQLSSSEGNSAGLSGSDWTSAWCRFQAANKRRPVLHGVAAGSAHPLQPQGPGEGQVSQ